MFCDFFSVTYSKGSVIVIVCCELESSDDVPCFGCSPQGGHECCHRFVFVLVPPGFFKLN